MDLLKRKIVTFKIDGNSNNYHNIAQPILLLEFQKWLPRNQNFWIRHCTRFCIVLEIPDLNSGRIL